MKSNQTGEYRLGYRGDIEGLRAIAILLVVACHAKVRWLAGGFVGVDVFFVLSGYLITGLLVHETRTSGELRFANFYLRRLRRLMPALLLMLLVMCVLGRLLLAPSGQPGQATAAASAALWLSNFHFAFQHMGYFAPGAETNLFLHTWSLGVEEQFYLVWPLLVVLTMGAWEGAKRAPSAARLKWLFATIFVLALGWSVYRTYSAPHMAFYMMPSRAWQFALGALTFLMVGTPAFHTDSPALPPGLLKVAGWIGLAMILLAAVLIDGSVPYPGIWALLPACGATLVLAAGGRGYATGVGRVLSWRPMQAIGRVSYSWYLWHWPVLLLGAAVLDTHNGWIRLALVAVSLLIAALSYRFFETPIRHNRKLLARPRMAVFVALAIMVIASSLALRWHNDVLARLRSTEQLPSELAHNDAPVIYRMGCDDWYSSARVEICAFGNPHATDTAIAMGDSVALQWFPAYAKAFDKPDWRLLVITKSSCPMVDVPIFYPRIGREYTECSTWRRDAVRKVAELKPDVLILGSTFTYDYTQKQWIGGTRRVLTALAGHVGRIYLMRSTPTLPFDGPSCVAPRSWLYRALSPKSQCTALARTPLSQAVFQSLQAAAAPFHNVRMIDMTNSVCPHGRCHSELAGKIVFRDNQHMTAAFARSLAPALRDALNIPGLAATPAVAAHAAKRSGSANSSGRR